MNLLLLLSLLVQEEKTELLAIKGGKLQTIAKGVVEEGVLLISGGKIVKVGKGLDIPLEAKVIELAKTASVTPGFIDLHSNLGSAFEIDELTEAITPHVRAMDAFSSDHPDVARAFSSGVTLFALAPGNGNLVSGSVSLLRLNGSRLDRMIFRPVAGLKISLTGEALFRDREPTSKSGAVQLLRRHLLDANGTLADRLLRKSDLAWLHAVSADEIQTAVKLKQEFGLRGILLHADEAVHVLEEVKNAELPVAVGPLTVSDSKEKLGMPGKLSRAGVRLGFVSDAPASDPSDVRVTAVLAVKYGLDKIDALRALTLSAAEIAGVAESLGSLEEGKLADLVVFSGDPLNLSSDVEIVVVGGRIVYQKKR